MLSFNEALKRAESLLEKAGKETRIATLLFEDMFNFRRIDFMVNGDKKISNADFSSLMNAVHSVSRGLPYQYVTGTSHFYGRKFKVNSHTLIPRNETEELVYLVSEKVKSGSIADIGTGTGAIGLTLKKENPNLEVILTDISKEALQVAEENMEHLSVNAILLLGDMLHPLIEKKIMVDVIISNPPYISFDEVEYMSESTLKYEPHSALFAEEEGLYFYREIIKDLDAVLKEQGQVFFEIGFKQGLSVRDLFLSYWPNSEVEIIKDINGLDRIIYAEWVR